MKLYTITNKISHFKYNANNGDLTVYWGTKVVKNDGSTYQPHALAHPALTVSAHMGSDITIQYIETEQGWKMIKPYPTAEELQKWEQAKAQREALKATAEEATAEQIALLTF